MYEPRASRLHTARSRNRYRLAALAVLAGVALIVALVGLLVAPDTGGTSGDLESGSFERVTPSTAGSATASSAADPVTTQTSTVPGHTPADAATPLPAVLPASAVAVHVPILMYHYVDDEPPDAGPYSDGLTVRTPDFEAQMQYLATNGYTPVTLADVYRGMAGLADLPAKPVALTFDDGGLDNYTVAYPILKDYGFVATFFVITGRVGDTGQMTWDHLREMAAADMSVQSHTVRHPDLRGVTADRLKKELTDSKGAIEEEMGQPVYALAYPAGAYDTTVMEATRAAGYVIAVASDKGGPCEPSKVLELKRVRVPAFLSLKEFARRVD